LYLPEAIAATTQQQQPLACTRALTEARVYANNAHLYLPEAVAATAQ
jgi:hypothetical protein